jgi:hypothetical protein
MAEKKKFLLRIDENIYASLEKWAADDLRSINAQIEFLLKDLLIKNNRLKNISAESSVESDAQKNNPE